MQHTLVFVEVLNELGDTAPIIEFVSALGLFALVLNRDSNTFVEESFFSQPLRKFVKTELGRVEDLQIGFEGDLRSAFASLAGLLQTAHWNSSGVILFVGQAVAPDFQMKSLRKKIYAGDADAVQTA